MTPYLNVRHSGETYKVLLKRAAIARRFTLRIRAATRDVTLTMPKRSAVAEAHEFAQRHAAWIGARLSRLPSPVPFLPGAKIPFKGVEHEIVHQPGVRGTVWVETSESLFNEPLLGASLLGGSRSQLCVAGDIAHVQRRIADFLKRSAKSELESAVARHAQAIGKRPLRVTLRDTSSRWGSCSASGSLNFSWRLILAPAYVLDYLAAHEVAHLVHLNHSPRFWKLVKSICDHTDAAEAWLSAHGASLHRYGKEASSLD